MSPRRRRSGASLVASRVVLLLVIVVGSLALTELVLRATAPAHDGYFFWPPDLDYVFDPAPGVMPGIEGPSRFRSNAEGLRADPLSDADQARVLCIGGSTTACIFLDQDETWCALLQRELSDRTGVRTWVGNAGKDGMSSRDHVVQMEKILPRLPRVDHVLALVGVNDLLLRLSQPKAYDPAYATRPEAEDELLVHAFSVRPDPEVAWYDDLRVLRLVRGLFAPTIEQGRLMDPQGDWYVGRRRQRQRARMLSTLPDVSDGVGEYARNLARMDDVARRAGTDLVLVTQPSIWRDDLPRDVDALLWVGGKGDFMNTRVDEYYTVPALRDGLELYNAATRRVAAERGLVCIDLAAQLPKDLTVFYDDVHFNESGARQVADRLADALVALPPFAR